MTGLLRLPGSMAEVDASPPGPGVGAFFDLDGTLVAGFTVAAVTRDRLRRREVGAAEFLQMMQLAVEYRLGRHQFENVIAGAVRTTKGRLAEDVDAVVAAPGADRARLLEAIRACIREGAPAPEVLLVRQLPLGEPDVVDDPALADHRVVAAR